jgi:MarR family transcriptional regulator, transcriptional regulator for hemolysin
MQLLIPWEEASLPLMLTVVRSRLRQVTWHLLAPHGITPQQYQVLRVLSDAPGICHGELAGALGLDKPTTTRMIQALGRKGWVEVLPHASHGRKTRLELSAGGRAKVESLAEFRTTVREGLEAGLDDGERKAVRALLLKLKTNLDHLDGAPAPSDLR